MKAMLLAGIVAAGIVSSAKADPAGDALSAKADECIRAAAPKISSMSQSLTETVNFLVEDLCVEEIKHADAYAGNIRLLEGWRATTAGTQLIGITVDPTSGELKTPPGFAPPLNTSAMMLNTLRASLAPLARYRSLAAKAVLTARAQSSQR